jgi:hypothetical protein
VGRTKQLTLRRVRVTTYAVEKYKVLNIMSVSVALSIQQVNRVRHIAISGLSGPTIFLHYLINGTILG